MAKDKPNKLRARMPRGFADRGPGDLVPTRAMLETIRKVYELYGFEALETPFIEYTDALGKFLPDQDRPNEGVFSFQDDDEQWLSLRYDLTAPLARHVAENFDRLPKPFRSYRAGWVFRNEKPGPGRFRQFMQFDADTVGAPTVAADAEICMMMADTLEALGIARGDYVIKVNNRKVLDGVLEAIGLGGDENAGRRLTVLRAIDKFDKVGISGVRDLLGEGRWENPEAKSGDFTKGAGLDDRQIHEILSLMGSTASPVDDNGELTDTDLADSLFVTPRLSAGDTPGGISFSTARGVTRFEDSLAIANHSTIKKLRAHFQGSDKISEGLDELETIATLARSSGYGSKRILIDPSVVRGLEYYTGPVFEAELTFEIPDERAPTALRFRRRRRAL
ncbi:ATP phosphoribosyltransferase regulatory subunit [Ancylobacter dichloromethanicus]|uniref:ATP phosphoribosyltransferase regulatory subunit n=1 Tax=Ancylobacter dichloromethanicus TaxID=518825 RepID=UPI00361D4061